MNFLSLIEAKREGHDLSAEQVREIITRFTAGQIPNYQMAAFLMAIYFRGLSKRETELLTLAMRNSGEVLTFPKDPRPLVDKHSTGGVGDKVSLPLAPLLACLGFRVPMISGRGLGITGGTLDKLDSIPGFKTMLPPDRIIDQVQAIGCVICGQTDAMVPADKAMYALRDVTGTVPSIPLIVASILSKKLAESLDALILDVKFGTAAFMQDRDGARELAKAMVHLGNQCGMPTRAILTNMSTPVGRAAGNWLEVKEAVDCLSGRGPEDLRNLVFACAAHLLILTKRTDDIVAAREEARRCFESAQPLRKWEEMLAAQGVDLARYHAKLARDTTASAVSEARAASPGFVSRCDARTIGGVIRDLGAGRLAKDAQIQYDVGIDQLAKPGERVETHGVLARIHAGDEASAWEAAKRVGEAFGIQPEPPAQSDILVETIGLEAT